MPDTLPRPYPGKHPKAHRDLLILYDDFVEFHNTCAFFCDSVMAMARTNPEFDRATVEGIASFSSQLKDTASELKGRLDDIRKECRL